MMMQKMLQGQRIIERIASRRAIEARRRSVGTIWCPFGSGVGGDDISSLPVSKGAAAFDTPEGRGGSATSASIKTGLGA